MMFWSESALNSDNVDLKYLFCNHSFLNGQYLHNFSYLLHICNKVLNLLAIFIYYLNLLFGPISEPYLIIIVISYI